MEEWVLLLRYIIQTLGSAPAWLDLVPLIMVQQGMELHSPAFEWLDFVPLRMVQQGMELSAAVPVWLDNDSLVVVNVD